METLFIDQTINEYANMLLNNGFDIIRHEAKDKWFSYHKNNEFGYFQQVNRFEGYSISTVHKANSKTGTGYRIVDPKLDLTLQDFEIGFSFAPSWAKPSDMATIKKYASLDEFLNKGGLKYEVIKANK